MNSFIILRATAPTIERSPENGDILIFPAGDPAVAVSMSMEVARKLAGLLVLAVEEDGQETLPSDVRRRIEDLTGYAPTTITRLGKEGTGLLLTNLSLRIGDAEPVTPEPHGRSEDEATMALWEEIVALKGTDAVIYKDGLGFEAAVQWRNGGWKTIA